MPLPDNSRPYPPLSLQAGVDEAGRGPLAGPVVAAAVILDPDRPVTGLADSKRLGAEIRARLAAEITAKSIAWAICRAEVEEIDRLNILQASLLAMQRAVTALGVRPDLVLVDGLHGPTLDCRVETVVRGDSKIAAISAASILAKVARDNEMIALDARYPGYGFAHNKGYPTPDHLHALHRLGVSPVHRRTFGPVRRLLRDGIHARHPG